MGNDIKMIGGKVGKIIQQFDAPQDHTDQGIPMDINQNIEDCKQLNALLLKHILNLGSKLQLEEKSISKNGPKWEKSIVRGILSVEFLQQREEMMESSEKCQQKRGQVKQEKLQSQAANTQHANEIRQRNLQKFQHKQEGQEKLQSKLSKKVNHAKRAYNIILTLREVYELKRMLTSYTQEEKELETKRKSFSGELCVICLDNKPEEVLPCAHQYCKKCVEMYIVNKDRKCPMCRKSYQESLSENIFQIVEWDEDFVVEMRSIFYKILEKNNPKQVAKTRKIIQANQKYEKSLTPKGKEQE